MSEKYEDWLTKQEAAKELGCSTKTIERYASQGRIERKVRKRPRLRPLPVYEPQDIVRLRAELEQEQSAPHVVEDGLPERTSLVKRRVSGPSMNDLFAMMVPAPAVRITEKVFLNLKEATEFSGLSKGHLLELIHSGDLPARKRGLWIIKRSDIETL